MVLVVLIGIDDDAQMPDARIVEGIELKFNARIGDLDVRGRRRRAATEALALGRGGIDQPQISVPAVMKVRVGESSLCCWNVG